MRLAKGKAEMKVALTVRKSFSESEKLRIYDFAVESNRIEGIHGEANRIHAEALEILLEKNKLVYEDVEAFVAAIQPDAEFRSKKGLDVRVGNHLPPRGGFLVVETMKHLLSSVAIDNSYFWHRAYETLHPFTDGNGRSGRAIWAWQMWRRGYRLELGFLHKWYYDSLN